MDMLESESITPMFMNTAISWNNPSRDLFTAWSMFIISTEIKLITDLKILNSEIKGCMIKLKRFVVGKRIQALLGLTNPDALNQELKDTEEESFVNATFPVGSTRPRWTITFCGLNIMTLLVIHRV